MSVIDLHAQACQHVFAKRVALDRQGHLGDIVPRDYNALTMAQAMSKDYPTDADGSVPAIEQK